MSDRSLPNASSDPPRNARRLVDELRSYGSCAVAYSGGVDSAVVAFAAFSALGDAAVAVTAVGPSLAAGELDQATNLAGQIGIRHAVIETEEIDQQAYTRNAPDRCYHCKTELYAQLARRLPDLGVATVANGTNADDTGDFRPGLRAAAEHEVRQPLVDCGLAKTDVRALAAFWELPVWDKEATPCLSSRIAYGQQVTRERLQMVDQAERYLRQLGLSNLRVRYHEGDLARIEVSPENIAFLCQTDIRVPLMDHFRALGFKSTTIDLDGFRSGNLNTFVPLEVLAANTGH